MEHSLWQKKQPGETSLEQSEPQITWSKVNEFSLSGRRRWGKEAEDDPGKCRRILECHGSAARKPNTQSVTRDLWVEQERDQSGYQQISRVHSASRILYKIISIPFIPLQFSCHGGSLRSGRKKNWVCMVYDMGLLFDMNV